MAVYRIEKTKNYTVMSNYHLRSTDLSLKAKGLLSMILSLPDDWNYTLAGLASICNEVFHLRSKWRTGESEANGGIKTAYAALSKSLKTADT